MNGPPDCRTDSKASGGKVSLGFARPSLLHGLDETLRPARLCRCHSTHPGGNHVERVAIVAAARAVIAGRERPRVVRPQVVGRIGFVPRGARNRATAKAALDFVAGACRLLRRGLRALRRGRCVCCFAHGCLSCPHLAPIVRIERNRNAPWRLLQSLVKCHRRVTIQSATRPRLQRGKAKRSFLPCHNFVAIKNATPPRAKSRGAVKQGGATLV